jgi:type IV pilus assembly protein PilA
MTYSSTTKPDNKPVYFIVFTSTGFTLIELMIVVAIIAIIITLALPVYTNYSIRAKISEALSVAAAAKTAVSATCMEEPALIGLNNDAAGYSYDTSSWVESITVSEDCTQPLITIVTRNTGAPAPAPEITLTGTPGSEGGKFTWQCASPNAPNHLVPSTCRS